MDTCRSRAQNDTYMRAHGDHRTQHVTSFQKVCACRQGVPNSKSENGEPLVHQLQTPIQMSLPPQLQGVPRDLFARTLRRAFQKHMKRVSPRAVRDRKLIITRQLTSIASKAIVATTALSSSCPTKTTTMASTSPSSVAEVPPTAPEPPRGMEEEGRLNEGDPS